MTLLAFVVGLPRRQKCAGLVRVADRLSEGAGVESAPLPAGVGIVDIPASLGFLGAGWSF